MTKTKTKTKHKYRPAFSEEEVEVLSTILLEAYLADMKKPLYNPKHPADSTHAFSPEYKLIHHGLVGKINTLRTKIANNIMPPAYTTTKYKDPAIEMLDSLGAPTEQVATLAKGESKEVYWKRCYEKYIQDPASCTVPEIEAAYEHMYLNDLMTTEEMVIHEGSTSDSSGAS